MAASGSSGSTSTVIDRQVKRNAHILFGDLHDTTLSLEEKLEQITEVLDGDNVNVNLADDRDGQNTMLHGAVSYGYVNIVKLLLEKGADVSSTNTAGETPLHMAVKYGYVDIVKLLLDKGADVNCKNAEGDTALHVPACYGHVEIVRQLLYRKAGVHIKNEAGESALHVSASKGNVDIVSLPLDRHADVSIKNSEGETLLRPLRLAQAKGFVDIVNLLENKDVKVKNTSDEASLHEAVAKGDVKTVRLLLEGKADVNAKNKTGDTPLHLAAARRTKKRNNVGVNLVNLLLKHKADVNSQNVEGKTPLHLAVEQSAISVVKLLLVNNANVNIKAGGKTPLDLAKEKGNKELMELLSVDSTQQVKDAPAAISTLSYTTCGAKKSSHGTLYQFHMLVCCLLRALINKYTFLLGTEVKEAQQFDDIVFKDLTNSSNIKKHLFVQAKHKANIGKAIKPEDILSTHKDADFSLLKYFKSYLCTPEAENTDFAICTNTCFAFKEGCEVIDNKLKVKLTLKEDRAFYSELFKEGKCYKLVTEDLSDLNKLFREMVNIPRKGETTGCVQAKELKDFMMLDDIGSQECWKTFLSKLTFIVDHPADEKMIKHDFGAYVGRKYQDNELLYNCFYNQMNLWSMKPVGTYITANSIPEAIYLIVTKFDNFSITGLTRAYAEELFSFPVAFNESVLDNLNQLLSDRNIVHLISPSIQSKLTAIQVAHAIKHCRVADVTNVGNSGASIVLDTTHGETVNSSDTRFRYEAADSFIFIRLKWLVLKDMTKKCIEAFKSPDSNNLLVIHVSETSDVSLSELSTELMRTVQENHTKKIVFIAPEDHLLPAMFNGCTRHNVTSVFQDLTPESQAVLLATPVTLQGESVELSQVIDKVDKDLLDLLPLEDLISDERLVIGTELPAFYGYDTAFYIERAVINRVEIKANILQDISEKKFNDHVAETESEFQKLCTTYPGKNIHLLREDNGRYIWVKSKGELNALQHYIDRSNSQSCSEDELLETVKDQRVVIISDTAGMGKSTILSHISKQIKDNQPGQLVFRVDLNTFSKVLKKRKSTKSHKSSAMDFLYDTLITIKTPLEKKLLNMEGKVALLFDGFDEISPDYDDMVIDLIQIIKEDTKAQIWITTRPFMREKLENKLHQFSFSLTPFSEENQVNFLTKYWKHVHDRDIDVNTLKTYASSLVTQLSSSINDKEREFTGIPLQVRMIAECYEDEVTGFSAPELGKQFHIVNLYKIFIEKKYTIFFKDKNNWDDSMPGADSFLKYSKVSFEEMHRWYACCLLFSKERSRSLFTVLHPDKSEVSNVNRIGIVNLINDVPLFVHRTFAEYLCADFVMRLLKETQSDELIDFVLSELLVSDTYLVFRAFFNGLLFKHEPQRNVLTWVGNKIQLLDNNQHDTVIRIFFCTANEGNQNILNYLQNCLHQHRKTLEHLFLCSSTTQQETLLHVAATGGHNNVVQILLQVSRDILDQGQDVVKKMLIAYEKYGRTALHLAAIGGHNNVVQTLLQESRDTLDHGQDVVREIMLAGNAFRFTALHLAAEGGHNNVVQTLLHVSRYTLDQGQDVVKNMVLDGNVDGWTALHRAAACGHNNVVQTLLQVSLDTLDQGQDVVSKMLLAVDYRTRTALHEAAEHGHNNVVQTLLQVSRDKLEQSQEVVRKMVLAGDYRGWTALHEAATGGYNKTIQTLLQTTRGMLGEQTLQLLLAMRDKFGKTALDEAVKKSKTASAELLRSFAAEPL